MKTLQLIPHPPYPPNSGGRIRQWEQIRYLASRYDLTVVCYAFTDEEQDQMKMAETICRMIVVKHPGASKQNLRQNETLPPSLKAYDTHVMREVLAEILRECYECVIVENIFMACYADLISVPAVLQEYNIESQIYRQYAELPQRKVEEKAFWRAAAIKMREYENRTWPKFALRTVVSASDQHEMETRCRIGKTLLLQNGVNVDEMNLLPLSRSKRLLAMGSLDYYPNSDGVFYLVKEIMPLVWKKDPEIQICIAGRNPQKAVLDLAANPAVKVIANPEDMREIAASCCASIVPLRMGGGTRIKILQAFAWGLPTVSTSVGCNGLRVQDGLHLLIRDGAAEFADAIQQLIADPLLRQTLRGAGRKLVEEHYDWRAIFPSLEQEIQLIVGRSDQEAVNQ